MRRFHSIALAAVLMCATFWLGCDEDSSGGSSDDTGGAAAADDDSAAQDDTADDTDDDVDDSAGDDSGDDTADDNGDDDSEPGCVWSVETVDTSSTRPAIVVDDSNTPLVAYIRYDSYELVLATGAGASWETEIVNGTDANDGAAITLDGNGNVHLAQWYYPANGGVPTLRHWVREQGIWSETPIFGWPEGTDFPDIAVESNGNVHIAAGVCTSGLDSHALAFTNGSGTWLLEWASALPETCPGVSLALDADGLPWVAFSEAPYMFGSSRLMVAHSEGVPFAWTLTEAAPVSFPSNFSLAVDASSRPVVAYNNASIRHMSVAVFESGTWQTTTLPWGGGIESGRAFAVDSAGSMHLVARDHATSELRYSTDRSGTWTYEVIATVTSIALANLALDADGEPHVVFTDSDADTVRYALCVEAK